MVQAVRRGLSLREAAQRYRVAPSTVQRWVDRTKGQRLDRVDWESRSRRPHKTTRISPPDEDWVLDVRAQLRDQSALGEYGADAILREIDQCQDVSQLSRSTISRILVRRGVVEKRRRVRRRAPPSGWYLPAVARGEVELDSFDYIEDLVVRGGSRFCVLTGISLCGGVPAAFLHDRRSAHLTVEDLVRHWQRHGRPAYAQFDNDVVFQGTHRHPDAIGRVARLCLSLDIVPVFAPPHEQGPQNLIEGFNSLWRQKVWRRHEWTSDRALRQGSDRYIDALLHRRGRRRELAPPRSVFPKRWRLDFDAPFRGVLIFLRRTDEAGYVTVLGHRIEVLPKWSHRLVRAEVDLDHHEIRIWGLRRREPEVQPLLKTLSHTVVQRPFRGRD